MSVVGGRRRRRRVLCLAILCVVWVLCFHCQAAAIPMFPPESVATKPHDKTTLVGRSPAPSDWDSPAGDGERFDVSKRRIPSCPDPLHNR
ncbi:putative CLAVATA3/ESR (CLE)-related protein 27 [Cocos nucifera]|uniref:Putative CLAVATA3/ESR (CLE)-related protein 27 n=1 Tax=Cocos nucifera TaxID=13894 RepID=A0A8K0I2U2_COCNU|nr:putative CLAVATA3/ESR (CLE)-related protein 27 [Cocos nucifera]